MQEGRGIVLRLTVLLLHWSSLESLSFHRSWTQRPPAWDPHAGAHRVLTLLRATTDLEMSDSVANEDPDVPPGTRRQAKGVPELRKGACQIGNPNRPVTVYPGDCRFLSPFARSLIPPRP